MPPAEGRKPSWVSRGDVSPLAKVLEPFMVRGGRNWIHYSRNVLGRPVKDKLQLLLPVAKGLQPLHKGLSFRFSDFVLACKMNNQKHQIVSAETEDDWIVTPDTTGGNWFEELDFHEHEDYIR